MPLEKTRRWPSLGELAGHEVVAGVEAGQPGEVGEAGVGRQDEDEHGAGLERVEQRPTERAGAVDEVPDLGDHRGRALLERGHLQVGAEDRQAEEHGAQQAAHDHQRRAGVAPGRLAERRHAVGDGLDAGHRRAAGGEGVQDTEQRGAHEQAAAALPKSTRPFCVCSATGRSPAAIRARPRPSSTTMLAMKK